MYGRYMVICYMYFVMMYIHLMVAHIHLSNEREKIWMGVKKRRVKNEEKIEKQILLNRAKQKRIHQNWFFLSMLLLPFSFQNQNHTFVVETNTLATCVVPQQPLTPLAFYSYWFWVIFFSTASRSLFFFVNEMCCTCVVIYDLKWKNFKACKRRRKKKLSTFYYKRSYILFFYCIILSC